MDLGSLLPCNLSSGSCLMVVSFQNVLRSWKLDGEVEKVLWNHFKPELLLVCVCVCVCLSVCVSVHCYCCRLAQRARQYGVYTKTLGTQCFKSMHTVRLSQVT